MALVEPLRELFKDEVRAWAGNWACPRFSSAAPVSRSGAGHPHPRRHHP